MHAYLSSTLGLAVAVLTATLASAKPEQIRSVTDPIFHLYLQAYPQDPTIPVMGPESDSEYFDITTSIQSTNTSLYLNIVEGDTASYKTLVFGEAGDTSGWGLEGVLTLTFPSFLFSTLLSDLPIHSFPFILHL
ncbi:hypothetical protein UCREL1_7885 [Eutypa lata UCREL1]|uniref:Uncharacterized protein n=1 Tax=Eutypa lata (strain UCR-EL1) TaxID=1287681 RepID=M7SLA3_EUTLA|nr:hypothetical protein UCREL1_7885 [Eutypa lata UCREL1]